MKPTNDLFARLMKAIHSVGLPEHNLTFLVAVSGGPDSVALLELLTKWRAGGKERRLFAAHYNHRLRPEADAEEESVRKLCRDLDVELSTGRGDVAAYAQVAGIAIHAAARKLRYEFLTGTARLIVAKSPLPIIVTGHHADDQVETVMMRLIGGSGVEGLGGIRTLAPCPGDAEIKLFRPLISIRKRELVEYCNNQGLPYVIDNSNLDVNYPRNRIRREILPAIEQGFGEAGVRGILRSAELLELTSELVEAEIGRALRDSSLEFHSSRVILDYCVYKSYFCLIRLALLQRSARRIGGENIRIPLERCLAADEGITSGEKEHLLGYGIHIHRYRDRIYIGKRPLDWGPIPFHPGEIHIPGTGELQAVLIGASEAIIPPPGGTLYLDPERLDFANLSLRPATTGDRMTPYGSSNSCKVTELLREANLPPQLRHAPLLISHGEIAALIPWRIAHNYRLTSDSKQALKLTLMPVPALHQDF